MNNKKTEIEIELSYQNLSETLMIKLENNFRKELFNHLKLKFSDRIKLCNYLCCSVSSYKYYARGASFIPVKTFQKAVKLCNFKDEKINSSILQVKKRICGQPINISLPVKNSPYLAALAGHTFGDGHLSSVGRFVYANNERTLINKVKTLVNSVFKSDVYVDERSSKSGCRHLHYPSAIGEMLEIFGCVKGNKTKQDFDIPTWVKDGNKKIKSAFLRALFDDEGTVSKTRLALNMSKIEDKEDSLINLLASFKKLLLDLNIKSSRTGLGHKRISKKNVRTTNLVFVISEYYNMKNFYENVGFDHPNKQKKLKNLLGSYIRPRNRTRKKILNLLSSNALSTRELMDLLGKTKKGVKYNLEILEKEGKVKRIIINKQKHLWKKNE